MPNLSSKAYQLSHWWWVVVERFEIFLYFRFDHLSLHLRPPGLELLTEKFGIAETLLCTGKVTVSLLL